MSVGVIIVVAGRHDHLARTLASLGHQSRPPDDVVVVDMAGDASTARLVDADARARRVTMDAPSTGSWPLAAARNAGARAVTDEHLVFLDVDCIAAPDLVATYDAAVARHPRSLICGPVRYLRPEWQHAFAWSVEGAPPTESATDSLIAASDAPAARPVPDDALVARWDHELFWSLAFATSRHVWSELGGFDEGYVGYGAEDTDFAQRARRAGIPMRWSRDGTAFHQWHPPSRDDPGNHGAMVANARRYRQRWGAWPMIGWLRELEQRGVIAIDDEAATIDLIGEAP
jgi:GT2 family glycosyltransferase